MAKRKRWTMREDWFRLAPGRSMRFWLQVAQAVDAQGVRRTDLINVKRIVKEMQHAGTC